MTAVGALVMIMLGMALACMSERYPLIAARIETMGGLCLIGGLAIIGAAIPGFR